MPAIYTCDICGKDAEDMDSDGDVLCELHDNEKLLRELETNYEEHKEWIRDTWVTELKSMRNEIKVLKSKIEEQKGERL